MSETNPTIRYSDQDLAEFKAVIEGKIAKTSAHLEQLQAEIYEITENTSDEHGGDWVDDSSINSDIEMLNNMAIRQRKHLNDLQNALVRIHNKTYGICVISGELIDKKRLMAVPTTTKSLEAKNTQKQNEQDRKRFRLNSKPYVKTTEKKVISKVIRRSKDGEEIIKKNVPIDDDDDDLLLNDISIDDDEDLGKKFANLKDFDDEDISDIDISDDDDEDDKDDDAGFFDDNDDDAEEDED